MLISKKEIILDKELKGLLGEKLPKEEIKRIEQSARKIKVTGIRYKSNGHTVNGYIVEPKKANKKLPCIIYNRGGVGEFSALNLRTVFTVLGLMASWGYIVIASQYSGAAGSEGKDEHGGNDLKDIVALRGLLAEYPLADIGRIGMFGASRGGMMTYLCLAKVKWLKAAVTVAGEANLFRMAKLRPEMKPVFREAFGGSKSEMRKRSAVFWAEKFSKGTPLLMMHGTADVRVSPLDSLELSTNLLKHGIHHRLILFENDDHFLAGHTQESGVEAKAWFDKFVKES